MERYLYQFINKMKKIFLLASILVYFTACTARLKGDSSDSPAGSLFIIGGGQKDQHLMQDMVDAAAMHASDYIVILPMASTVAAESVADMEQQLREVTDAQIWARNFTRAEADQMNLVDSVRNAKLIYITGGDQNRFMDVVQGTALFKALHEAYQNGACIAGTSAGAAMMSEYMMSGNQLLDTTYRSTFPQLLHKNIELSPGLGLLKTAIVDQHFLRRSRYNRLFSALAAHPQLLCIGIDESTAILVRGDSAQVFGESQVVLARDFKGLSADSLGKITFDDVQLSIYEAPKKFSLLK